MKVAKLYLHEVEEFEGVSGGTSCHQVGYELSFTRDNDQVLAAGAHAGDNWEPAGASDCQQD